MAFPYAAFTWVDDDGSGTVGTLYSAARMNQIEEALAKADKSARRVKVIPVRVATITALPANTRSTNTLTANANGALGQIDGVTIAVGEYVLVQDESKTENHGVYKILSLGGASEKWSMERVPEYAETEQIASCQLFVPVYSGDVNADRLFEATFSSGAKINEYLTLFSQVGSRDFGLASAPPSTARAIFGDRCMVEYQNNKYIELVFDVFSEWKKIRSMGQGPIPCRYATAEALPTNTLSGSKLTATSNATLKVDGGAIEVGDYILVKNEAEGKKNGVYKVLATGSAGAKYELERVIEMSISQDIVPGMMFTVAEGTVCADSLWMLTNNGSSTINTTALTFARRGGAFHETKRCTADVKTTTSNQDITGCSFTVAEAGKYSVRLAFDAGMNVVGTSALLAQLLVGGSPQTGEAIQNLANTGVRETVYQEWTIEVAAGTVVKTACRKLVNAGEGVVFAGNTALTVSQIT